MKVYRYVIPNQQIFSFDIPKDAEILSVEYKFGTPSFFILVNDKNKSERRHFILVGTGWDITAIHKIKKYIGSFSDNEGFTGHLFEVEGR